MVKYVEINAYACKTLLKAFDKSWGVRNVICGHDEDHFDMEKTTFVTWLAWVTWWLGSCMWLVRWGWSLIGWLSDAMNQMTHNEGICV